MNPQECSREGPLFLKREISLLESSESHGGILGQSAVSLVVVTQSELIFSAAVSDNLEDSTLN